MSSETTSLLASNTDNNGPPNSAHPSSYYFLEHNNENADAGGSEQVLEQVPMGAVQSEFSARAVGSKSHSTAEQQRGGFWNNIFAGAASQQKKKSNYGEVGTLVKDRKVPIKVEPKVFFANERTFLAWSHTSVLLAGTSMAIVAFADANPWSQLYGIILLPVAVSFICYSMYQYSRRSGMIRRKDPGPYEDTTGPIVLGIMLMLSIVAQFVIKLYSLM